MRSSVLGFLTFLTAAPYAHALNLVNADDNNWCVSLEIHNKDPNKPYKDLGYALCAPDVGPLSNWADPGATVIIWAQWDPTNHGICGWSAGEITFTMPSGGEDLIFKNNCVMQPGSTWSQCTVPVPCSISSGANPYYLGNEGVCNGKPEAPPGTGCIVGQ